MKKITVNGKEVNTNYGAVTYPRLPDTMNARPLPFGMSEKTFLEQLVEEGCSKVTFYEVTTCVRGYHKVYANCK